MNFMTQAIDDKIYTLDEYILLDEASDIRHEFINGQLYDMSGATDLHNEICFNLTLLFKTLLGKKGFKVYMEGVKCKIQGEEYYTYPDVFITNNESDHENKYIKQHPSLIIEVLSDSTRKYDSVDKFIQYQKIDSLQYYILVEPEVFSVHCFSKEENGEWQAAIFTKLEEVIELKLLSTQLPLEAIYKS
jgi:Uma2 family endonuclease